MAKKNKTEELDLNQEMTLEEAAAYRASLYVPQETELSVEQKREEFRIYWAQNRKSYNQPKEMEEVLWLHLKAIKATDPSKFEGGIAHFGFKKK